VARTVLVVALMCCAGARAQDANAAAAPSSTAQLVEPLAPALAPAPAPATAVVSAPLPRARMKRVYVAPFTGETSDPATLDLVEDRVLVAARAVIERTMRDDGAAHVEVELIGARDVQGILDVEAAKAAAGCDSTSCANEIADALNADEIVFGQLGRIGDTWQLTLTRTHRATLRVLGRSVKEARGETPEGLLGDIRPQVEEVFGVVATGPSALAIAGMGMTALGAAGVVVGGVGYGYSWIEWANADTILKSAAPDVPRAQQHERDGRNALTFAYAAGGIGVAVVAIGATLWFLGSDE
jgi:hypothetical protein